MAKKGNHRSKHSRGTNESVKTAPRTGPSHNVRFRNRDEKRAVARAAKALGLTINTYIVETLAKATSKATGAGQ